MNKKYTPAPWKVLDKGQPDEFVVFSGKIKDGELHSDDARWIATTHNSIEDALLIAAAPELLEVCMNMVEKIYHRPDGIEVEISDYHVQEMINAIKKAMGGKSWSAIAKAKGETK